MGETEDRDEALAQRIEHVLAAGCEQDQGCEQDLQGDAGDDQAPVDRAPIERGEPGDADQAGEAEQAEGNATDHVFPSPGRPGAAANGSRLDEGQQWRKRSCGKRFDCPCILVIPSAARNARAMLPPGSGRDSSLRSE